MKNEIKGAKSIQTLLTVGLVFQIVYLVSMWLANMLQSSYMFLFTEIELDQVMDVPHFASFFSIIMAARFGERAIIAVSCVRNVENMVNTFYSVAIALLLCAYAMYWYGVKYMPQDEVRNDWAM